MNFTEFYDMNDTGWDNKRQKPAKADMHVSDRAAAHTLCIVTTEHHSILSGIS